MITLLADLSRLLNVALKQIPSERYTSSDQISTKITVVRLHPYPDIKGKNLYVDFFSCCQEEYSTSKTGILFKWWHILVNHQENAIVGIDGYSVTMVIFSTVEEHLQIDIVTATHGYLQSSFDIHKAVHQMTFRIVGVPRRNF